MGSRRGVLVCVAAFLGLDGGMVVLTMADYW